LAIDSGQEYTGPVGQLYTSKYTNNNNDFDSTLFATRSGRNDAWIQF